MKNRFSAEDWYRIIISYKKMQILEDYMIDDCSKNC